MQRVFFVIAPAFELLDLSGPLCAFSLARNLCGASYELTVISATGGPVTACGGISVQTAAPSAARRGDTVVVVGGPMAPDVDRGDATIDLLRALRSDGARMASVCTGAFLLAETGALDGRRATTHWRYAPLLRSRYPNVVVEPDGIFVNDDGVWSSAGISAGIDLALAMIEADCGPDVARTVAREMVVTYRRPGGQSQFSTLLDVAPAAGRVRDALAFAREHLHEPLPVERLAEVAGVSPRQFARLFLKETGETPARALERMRTEVARARVEEGQESAAAIAQTVGFGDVERMRRSFVKFHGRTPQAMRRSARAQTK